MKKLNNTAKQNCSFRRFVSNLFSSFIKRRGWGYQAEIETVIEMLRDIEDSIKIIAREIEQRGKRGQ